MGELILQIINILAPGLVLALIGLAWARRGPHFPVDFVTTLVLQITLPALLFHTLATSSVDIQALTRLALSTLIVHVVFLLLAVAQLRFADKDWRLSIAHVVGNTGNLGLPVCFFAFGDEGLAFAMAFFSVQCIFLFTIGDAVYAGSASLARLIRSPVLIAIALGVTFRLFEIPIPHVVLQTSILMGQIVIPLMLITLGVSLASMTVSHLRSALVWASVRTVTAMTIGFSVAELMGLEGVARGVLVIETVVPVAVFNYLLATKHGRNAGEVSAMILVTHIAAIAYLPVIIALVL